MLLAIKLYKRKQSVVRFVFWNYFFCHLEAPSVTVEADVYANCSKCLEAAVVMPSLFVS